MFFKRLLKNPEGLFWMGALLVLGFTVDFSAGASGFCPLLLLGWEKITGWTACPGCGLGRSLAAALHGQWKLSWQHHWFGFPALLIISARIVSLVINPKDKKNQLTNGYLPDGSSRPST